MNVRWIAPSLAGVLLLGAGAIPAYNAAAARMRAAPRLTAFSLAPASTAIAACLPHLQARATVVPGPQNDTLSLRAAGLPAFAALDLYITELPHAPFGLAWPLSMLQADAQGIASVQVQTTVLQASGLAGTPRTAAHLAIFFDDPNDADPCFGGAGAPVTAFNAAHHAGPAVLATTGFPDAAGPLRAPAFALPGVGISTPSLARVAVARSIAMTNTCNDPDGWKAIRYVDFRLSQPGRVVLWARLDRPAQRMYLYDPATGHWLGGRVGSDATLTTAAAQLSLRDSRILGTPGTTGAVRWSLSFTASVAGQTLDQSVRVTDMRAQSRGWHTSGTVSIM